MEKKKVVIPSFIMANTFIQAWAKATGDSQTIQIMTEITAALMEGKSANYEYIDKAGDRLYDIIQDEFMFYHTSKDLPQDRDGLDNAHLYEYEMINIMAQIFGLLRILKDIRDKDYVMELTPSIAETMMERINHHSERYKTIIADRQGEVFKFSE